MRLGVKSAKLVRSYGDRFGTGKLEPSDWRVILRVEPIGLNLTELTTGEKLRQCALSVNFRPMTDDLRSWIDQHSLQPSTAIGMAHYFGDHIATQPDDEDLEASIQFEIMLSAPEFIDLVDFARLGRFPREVSLAFPDGMVEHKYGGFRWDNAKKRILPIAGVDIEIGVSDPPTPDAADIALDRAVGAAPRTPVGADLRPTLDHLLRWQQATLFVIAIAALWLLAS